MDSDDEWISSPQPGVLANRDQRDQGDAGDTPNPRPKNRSRNAEAAHDAEQQAEEPADEQASAAEKRLMKTFSRMLDLKLAPTLTWQKAVVDRMGNMELWRHKIDPVVTKHGERLDGQGSSITRLLEGLKRADTQLAQHISQHQIKVKEMETLHNSLVKKHTELQGGLDQDVGRLEKKVEDEAEALGAAMLTFNNRLEALEGRGTGETGAGLGADVELLRAQLAEIMSSGRGNPAGPRQQDGEIEQLRTQVVALQAQLAALPATHAHGGAAGMAGSSPPSAASIVEGELRKEAEVASRVLKLVGFVERREGHSGVLLCQEVGDELSRLVGRGVRIEVERAGWAPVQEGRAPLLIVTTRTQAMAAEVRQLKLGASKRIMGWFGRVEMAVRDVLFKERDAMLARDPQADVRVVGSRLIVGGKAQPLPQAAVTAGMRVATEVRPQRPAQPKPHGQRQQTHQQGRQQRGRQA